MSLKRELENSTSTLRVTLEEMLPNLGKHARSTWNPKLKGSVAQFNPDLPPDVLGHAISERFAWQFAGTGGELQGAGIVMRDGANPRVVSDLIDAMSTPCPNQDPDREARIACQVGLIDRSLRTGLAEEPWYEPLLTANTLDDALRAVDPAWVDDVTTTTNAALNAAAPLAANTPVHRGPTFAGSRAVGGADADLILGPALLELKTVRSASLIKRDLQQVVTYALLDWDNRYALNEVAILSARHGALVRWPLNELIHSGSNGNYDLSSARTHLAGALRTRPAN